MTGPGRTMEYVAKLVVLISVAAALFIAARLNARGWSAAFPLAVGACGATALLSVFRADLAAVLVLLFAFTFPVFVAIAPGQFGDAYTGIWMAALYGLMLPRSVGARGWSFPAPWKLPLACWALTIAVVWPFVALRQIDFFPAVLDLPHMAVSVRGVLPQVGIVAVINTAMTLVLGILWFEWLFLIQRLGGPEIFERRLVPALIVSFLVATFVGLYQLFVDVTFLNSGLFGFRGRASGTLRDANVFGTVAALCAPVVVLFCRSLPAWWRYPAITIGLLLCSLGVWGSGSRTALAAEIIALAFMADAIRRASTRAAAVRRVLVAGTVGCGLLLAAALWGNTSATGPIGRLGEYVPTSMASVADSAYELLWRRDAYGTVAVAMIRDFPAFGVGVGAFHLLTADYGRIIGHDNAILQPDNAQNWFRHQLAEFGLLGSVGWVAWAVMFGQFLFRALPPSADQFSARALRGAILALTLISLVGMPSQHVAVTLLFWTLAYWYVRAAAGPVPSDAGAGERRDQVRWALVFGVAICCGLGAWYFARHDLRIAEMATRVGWDYSYGLYDVERTPDGSTFRWTMQRAVTVVPAPKPWLKMTVMVNHADLAARPVQANVWSNGVLVVDETLTRIEPVTKYIPVPGGDERIILEFRSNRVVRPSAFGLGDPRELGLQVDWTFVDRPPAT